MPQSRIVYARKISTTTSTTDTAPFSTQSACGMTALLRGRRTPAARRGLPGGFPE
jgi:hypothetical protein